MRPSQPWAIEELADRLSAVVASITGAQTRVQAEAAEVPENGLLLWWRQDLGKRSGLTFWIGAPQDAWQNLGAFVLSSAGVRQPGPQQIRGAYDDVLNQTLTAFSQACSRRLHRDLVCADGWESGPLGATINYRLNLILPFGDLEFFACFGEKAFAAFENDLPETSQTALRTTAGSAVPKSFDLLIDVELPVSVSFGRTQLPLRDVLKLTTGSIVELNRALSEPVEVIVNNCVIARGEVVVVDGSFGVRISEVVSRQDRLGTVG